MMDYRDLANLSIIKTGYELHKLYPDRVILFRCFNKEEAEWFERVAKSLYPDFEFQTSWLEFQEFVPA